MTVVLMVGPCSAEVERLARSLPGIDPGLSVDAAADDSPAALRASNADVALVSADGDALSEAAARVAQAQEAGLAVVVLLPAFDLLDLDPAAEHLDFCFPPFVPEEVALRLRVAAARAGRGDAARALRVGPLLIDQEQYEVRLAGRKVALTYKEYELLRVLASNPGRVFSREALLRTVWEYDYFGGTRTVDVHVRRLRSKINDVQNRFIETVRNVGYRFRAPEDSSPE